MTHSIAYDLAVAEVEMLLDCVSCNEVTAYSANEYLTRISLLCSEASTEVLPEETQYLEHLERSALDYVCAHVGNFEHNKNNDTVSVPDMLLNDLKQAVGGVTKTLHGYAVAAVTQGIDGDNAAPLVVLSSVDDIRFRRFLESVSDPACSEAVASERKAVTDHGVVYELSNATRVKLRHYMKCSAGNRTVRLLASALGEEI